MLLWQEKGMTMIIKSYSTIQEIESIAKSFLPDIVAFFETEEGRREFEERREKKNQ